MSYEEVQNFLEVVDPHYRPYFEVAFFTGMRAGEQNALYWSDYKKHIKKIHINKTYVYGQEGKTKTKKSKRYIDLLPMVIKALKDQEKVKKDLQIVFLTKDGRRIHPDHIRDVIWKPAMEKAGLEYRPPMQTRHTFATMMLSAGEDPGWVQNMLGHSSLQMLFSRYYAWIPKKTRTDGAAFLETVKEVEKEETKKVCPKIVPLDEFRKQKRG